MRARKKELRATASSLAKPTAAGRSVSFQSRRGSSKTSSCDVGIRHQRVGARRKRFSEMHSLGPSVATGSISPPSAASTARFDTCTTCVPCTAWTSDVDAAADTDPRAANEPLAEDGLAIEPLDGEDGLSEVDSAALPAAARSPDATISFASPL